VRRAAADPEPVAGTGQPPALGSACSGGLSGAGAEPQPRGRPARHPARAHGPTVRDRVRLHARRFRGLLRADPALAAHHPGHRRDAWEAQPPATRWRSQSGASRTHVQVRTELRTPQGKLPAEVAIPAGQQDRSEGQLQHRHHCPRRARGGRADRRHPDPPARRCRWRCGTCHPGSGMGSTHFDGGRGTIQLRETPSNLSGSG
jgi:hypothetical protein